MFARSTRESEPRREGEAGQPLLAEHESASDDRTLFAVADDEFDIEESALETPEDSRRTHSVRFDEDVHVIPPPLRSTTQSRETAFDLDNDDLDGEYPDQLRSNDRSSRSGRRSAQTMPLLVGLLDASAARRSLELAIPLHEEGVDGATNGHIDLDELVAKRNAGGGLFDSIANMANSILGAGIIGLPYAMRQAGLVTGIVLLIVLCAVTDWTIRLIVINAKMSGANSYIDIMNRCFGSSGRAAVSFFQFAFAFGGMCAFGIIIGDTIPHVIRSIFPSLHTVPVLSLLTKRQFIIALCTLGVSYPLSLYRDIHKLARASGLALVGMIVIVSSVMIKAPSVAPALKGDPDKRFSVIGPGIFQAVGVISFAFVCHHNSLLIYGSLRTPTLDRFALVTHISTIISLVCCCTLAISAYIQFTDKTQGNILNNFSGNDTLINLARFCFGLNMFTTLPLELFVCRETIEQYFFSHEPFNLQRHVLFTTSIIVASMFIALITCDLGVMLEITGGVSATALAYIFPAACYMKLSDPLVPWYSRKKLPAAVCAAFGGTVLCISLFLALGKAWTPEGDAKICMM